MTRSAVRDSRKRPVDVGLAHHPREFFGRHPAQHVGRALARSRDHDEVAQAFEQVVDEAARVLTGLHHPVDRRRRRPRHRPPRTRRRPRRAVRRACSRAARPARAYVDDGASEPAISWSRSDSGVARRSAAGANDQRQHAGSTVTPSVSHSVWTYSSIGAGGTSGRVVVRARADRADDLLGLGRGEDELHVVGRLFDELEQGVEALRRDHVRLVEDEDLEPVARGANTARSRRSRASSTPLWLAASISTTSSEPPPLRPSSTQLSQTPHGTSVGPFGAVQAARETRADVVLPHPRGPENRYA
jgi:hypothetical protein